MKVSPSRVPRLSVDSALWRTKFCAVVVFLLCALPSVGAIASEAPVQRLIVGKPVRPTLTPPLRDLPTSAEQREVEGKEEDRENPLEDEPDEGRRGTWNRTDVPLDALAAKSARAPSRTPATSLTFEGVGNPTGCGSCSPPDTVGDIGPHHYVQMVNATKVAIYSKAGALLAGPFNLSTFWSSANCTANAGDPVVVYDPLADRWLLTQFATPNHTCMAVSQTPDPTGSYFIYTFDVGVFPDYLKFGVWPNAYLMAANEDSYSAYAFDRVSMLAGAAATFVKFTGGTNFYMPADVDGVRPPVSAAAPFYTFKDSSFHGGGVDRLEINELTPNFATPGLSTFSLVATIPITTFTYTVCGFFNLSCARQAGTLRRLDVVSEWPMFRAAYRNFGTHESLVGTFTVNSGAGEQGAAPRWFELRRSGGAWALQQEGTYAPDALDRFMGSTAMDGKGDIAVAYTASSSVQTPSIRYATRLAGDAAGTLGTEATLIEGGGSQTGSNRWGDYSALSTDPTNDCVFYATNEYYSANASTSWKTRVGAFRIPGCETIFFDGFETGATARWDGTQP